MGSRCWSTRQSSSPCAATRLSSSDCVWGGPGSFRNRPNDTAINASVDELLAARNPAAFPILLAHHPHAFDPAAAAGLPLTLAGHTHGGQLMLNAETGFGPMMFRYWSGLYTRAHSHLVASRIGFRCGPARQRKLFT